MLVILPLLALKYLVKQVGGRGFIGYNVGAMEMAWVPTLN